MDSRDSAVEERHIIIRKMKQMTHPFITDLRTRASNISKRIVLTDGDDARVLAAAHYILKHTNIQLVLIGDTATLLPLVKHYKIKDRVEIYDPHQDDRQAVLTDHLRIRLEQRSKPLPNAAVLYAMACDPVYCGTLLVKVGIVDGMVGGATIPTASVIRAGLQIVGFDPERPVVSGAFVMLLAEPMAAGQQALVFADVAVIPQPNAEQLANITINTVNLTRAILGQEPIVALLSFSTHGSSNDPSVTKVRNALKIVRQSIPTLRVDGEMQVDAALIPAVSAHKAPGNLVNGQANVLIFPNLDASNAAYKLVERIGKATALGVILSGLTMPLNDLSRGCNSDDIVNMVVVTALQCTQIDRKQ